MTVDFGQWGHEVASGPSGADQWKPRVLIGCIDIEARMNSSEYVGVFATDTD